MDSFVATPFGKFERFTASFCMAIPFLLIIVDNNKLVLLLVPLTLVFLITLLTPLFIKQIKNQKNAGLWITVVGGILLFGLYLLFTLEFKLESKDSISAYVTMPAAHIFGMLLAIASLLFITSGFVYRDEKHIFSEGWWRSLLNIALGLLLLGIIIFRYDRKMATIHMICAGLFFAGCALSTLFRETKKEKQTQQQWVDFTPVAIMGIALLIYFGQKWGWWSGYPYDLVNLFGAESIALWITGLDFILVSLKRERRELAEKKMRIQEAGRVNESSSGHHESV